MYSDSNRLTVGFPAGGLEYETQTRESGGTTNLNKTQYAYSWIAAGSPAAGGTGGSLYARSRLTAAGNRFPAKP
jgi:hypothetical protein